MSGLAGDRRGWCGAVAVGVVLATGALVQAAGTDLVRVAGGVVVRGSVLSQQADGSLRIAVRRAWLAAAEPGLAREAEQMEARETPQALEQLAERIDMLLAAPVGSYDESLLAFLRREQTRVRDEREADSPPRPRFMVLNISGKRVRNVEPADPAWRRLVQWGWHEGIDDVETMPQRKLVEALAERSVDTTAPPPSLADQLPPLPQDDEQWRARIALLQDAYGDSVSFQGTGDIVVRADQEVTIDALLPVVTDMLKGDVGGLLDLFGGSGGGRKREPAADRWLASARSQAGSEGRFRATRVQTKPDQGLVSVESRFEVQLTDGSWGTVWQSRTQIDASKPRPGLEERIASDPRVGQAINAIKLLGVIDEEAMTKAIRFGAATMEAQEVIDRQFAAFRSDHTLRLDGPPLPVVR
jgi:hypothetical protein